MKNKEKYKIFLGVQEIAGMMERLNRAFRKMGVHCDYFCMYDYKFSSDIMRKEPEILKNYKIHTNNIRTSERRSVKRFWYFFQMIDIIHIFVYSLLHYNEFIYIAGHGMFLYNCYLKHIQEVEFFLLKMFKKKVIVWLCGSDSRAPYCGVDIYDGDIKKMWKDTKKKRKKIGMLEKYATLIDGPASSHFHNKPFVVYTSIGIPVDEGEKASGKVEKGDKVVILHAPSSNKFKGTYYIRQIVEELVKEKYNIEYIEVSGLPHTCVLEKLIQADIVIDQVFSDTPMAGFAAEAAYNGVPVVVAGEFSKYYREELPEPIPPTLYCTLDEMKDKLVWLIENPHERIRIGREEKEFIDKNYLSDIVAEKFCRIFENEIPGNWWFAPDDNVYPFGLGLHRNDVVKNVINLIDAYGEEALGIPRERKLFSLYQEIYKQYKNTGLS